MEKQSWEQIKQCADYHGRWLALSNCRYDEATGQAVEGKVIDHDEELATLCSRLQEEERKSCAIVFCKGDEEGGFATKQTPSARCA